MSAPGMTGGSEIIDGEIRRYLLGQMSTENQDRVEERLVIDGPYFERVELAEDDLIEAYLANDLAPVDRESFENHFLTTPERVERLEMSRTLRRVVTASAEPAPLSRFPTRWLALAASLLICLASVGYSIWRVRSVRNLLQEIAARGERIQILEEQLRRAQSQKQNGPAVLSFLLFPDLVLRGKRAEISKLLVTSRTAAVEINLAQSSGEGEPIAGYSAALKTGDGLQVWSSKIDETPAGPRRTMTLRLPAGLLAPGQYRLTLFGILANGELDELEYYSFRVVQR